MFSEIVSFEKERETGGLKRWVFFIYSYIYNSCEKRMCVYFRTALSVGDVLFGRTMSG